MKRILKLLIVLVTFLVFNVYAQDNTECVLDMQIVGQGTLIDQSTNIKYNTNSTINMVCENGFNFLIVPEKEYKLANITYNNVEVNGELTSSGMRYSLSKLENNKILKITFVDEYEIMTVSDGTIELNYSTHANRLEYITTSTSVELSLSNIKSHINLETTLRLNINGVIVSFPAGFLDKYKDETIRFSVHEMGSNVLSDAQKKSIKEGVFYDINFFVQKEKVNTLDEEIEIKIPYKAESGYVPLMYYIDLEGEKTQVNFEYENEYLVFNTKKISLIGVAKEKTNISTDYDNTVDKVEKITKKLSSLDTSKIFTIGIIIAFIIYLIHDFLKKQKS
jgi:hypothetical protein